MSKQTAVEWLVEHLNLDETSPNYNNLTIKKAKEMEKEQITDAAADHCYPTCELARIDAEKYYNKTYKNK